MSSSGESRGEGGNGDRVEFLYAGQAGIPRDVTHVRVDPSIKRIGVGAFDGCKRLRAVELCEGLEIISEYAFGGLSGGCASLERVRIPPTVKKIGRGAFEECERLEEVDLCEGVGGVGESAFSGCKSLKRIAIPSTVERIGGAAFGFCERLEELELREGVAEIGGSAFDGCKCLKRVRIPSTVKNIGGWAFKNCEQLEGVDLCEGLENIGKRAFAQCKSLRHMTFPSTLNLISEEAFQCCHKLEKVDFREGLEQIGQSAFESCKSLRHIRIPSSVKTIGKMAFNDCIRLVSVELDDGLEEIGESAFENGFSLRNISIPSTVKNVGGDLLRGCHDIRKLLGAQNKSVNALKCRLAGLPIHQLCYNQARRPSRETFEHLQNIICMMPDQVEASIPAESSPDQKNRNLKRAATWSQRGPKTKVRCHGASSSIAASESAVANDLSYPALKMYNAIDHSQDCLGMTPLHILTCSTKQNLDLYQIIIANQPECLITKDEWGCLPLFYAIWGGLPLEIVQFLIDSHRTTFPDIDLNWDMMVSTLCRAEASLDDIQMLLGIQQASFPEQSINFQRAARELAIRCLVGCDPGYDSFGEDFPSRWKSMMAALNNSSAYKDIIESLLEVQQSFFPDKRSTDWQVVCEECLLEVQQGFFPDHRSTNWQVMCEEFAKAPRKWCRTSFNPFQFLVRCNISERLDEIRVGKWQMDVKDSLARIATWKYRHGTARTMVATRCDHFHSKLVSYECKFRQLKESTFLLELALWKCRIGEIIAVRRNNAGPSNGLDGIDADTKTQYRVSCGAEIIIPNVLPYLIDNAEKDNVSGADGERDESIGR